MMKMLPQIATRAGLALLIGTAALAGVAVAQDKPAAEQPAAETATPTYPLVEPEQEPWSFAGIFGRFDTAQLQRGYQVYKEVCSNCHSMHLVSFRNLGDEGGPHFTEAQVKTVAATYQVPDLNDAGETVQRPARPSDRFPSPFPNPEAAAAANNGKAPPDLSLIAKARYVERGFPWFILDFFTQTEEEAGPDYIHGLLTGYKDAPAGVTVPPGLHYNPHFISGPAIAMPPPLSDGQVTYTDGSPQTVDQYARDVAAFLMWTAEPHLDARKRTGFQVIIFLIVFSVLLGLTKRKIWAKVAH